MARRQHATVARPQLVALGFGRHAIARMLAKGQLHVVHRSVYAVGPARPTRKGRWMAAVVAGGPGAVLSHRSAAALWHLIADPAGDIEVTSARRSHRRPGILLHFAHLAADEVTIVDGIPVTTVARTLLDIAAVLPVHRLERAMNEAEVQRLWDHTGLHALLDRHPRRYGSRALRAILAAQELGRTITRSELEQRFLAFLEENVFPRHETNVLVSTAVKAYECDFVWPEARLIVELDGYETHGTRRRFEEDRDRDRALTLAGWRVIRITWRQLSSAPHELARDLWALLGRPPAAVAC